MQPVIEELSLHVIDVHAIQDYVTAGNATFTLRSVKTGKRFTYKVTRIENSLRNQSGTHFVALLTGPDNEGSFTYLGVLNNGIRLAATAKSKHLQNSTGFQAMKWFMDHLSPNEPLLSQIEFWHSGRCGRCGRKLTVPESIAAGIGPECATKGF